MTEPSRTLGMVVGLALVATLALAPWPRRVPPGWSKDIFPGFTAFVGGSGCELWMWKP